MGRISLVKVGGVCAILAVETAMAGRILFSFADTPHTDDVGNILLAMNNVRAALLTGHWFDVLALTLTMAVALGFYQALREGGPLLWIALAAFFTGTIFILGHEFIRLGIAYELAPSYAAAGEATRPALEVMASTLRQTSRLAVAVGQALIFGIGIALFTLATIRTSVAPRWIGWLGLIVALLGGWLALLTLVSGVFYPIGNIGLLACLVWAAAMGVAMLRMREPVAGTAET